MKVRYPEETTAEFLDLSALKYSRLLGHMATTINLLFALRKHSLTDYFELHKPSGNDKIDAETIALLITLGEIDIAKQVYDSLDESQFIKSRFTFAELLKIIVSDVI